MNVNHRLVAGRLAPSPTGGLHVGHARTFLAAWLFARGAGGRVILRIEDLDAARVRPEAARGIVDDLHWLGLDWDEGPDVGGPFAPYVQSERVEVYSPALNRLKEAEKVYPCTCTRAEIARAATAPHAEDEGPNYPGTCAHRKARDAEGLSGPLAWRFRVPVGQVGWNDLLRGPTSIDPSVIGGDFVVAREGAGPSYQLAVVCDDAAMGVTQVIRGDDLVASTPRQLSLYRALGFAPPAFGHIGLVHGVDGRRLAKRDASIKLAHLRDAGLDPRRLIGRLAQSLGQSTDAEPSSPADWLGRFDPALIPRTTWKLVATDLAG